jgi:hypothetical protein
MNGDRGWLRRYKRAIPKREFGHMFGWALFDHLKLISRLVERH